MKNSLALDTRLRELNCCGCCEGLTVEAPVEVWNRPGLPIVAARVGTHSRFKASLLARLSSRDFPALHALRTRDDDDFSIAWLDAWAVIADIITFYQERIANESYLRTATERRSLRELGRLIGYELRPGVAASAPLAFTIEDAQGGPSTTRIEIGVKVQSIPGPGQTPQVFETVEAIDARPEWNAIHPRLTQPQLIATTMKSILVQSASPNIEPGDTLLIVAGATAGVDGIKRVRSAESDTAAGTTKLVVEDDPPDPPQLSFLTLAPAVFLTQPLSLTTNNLSSSLMGHSWSHASLVALTKVQKWPLASVKLNLKWHIAQRFIIADKGVFVFRQKASIFGHNAPKHSTLPDGHKFGGTWEGRTLATEAGSDNWIYLDTTYSKVVPGSYIVIETPGAQGIFKVEDHAEVSRADFTLSAKVSRLKVTHISGASLSSFKIRETTVHLESEELPLAPLPILDEVSTAPLALDGPYPELFVGQRVILTGQPVDLDGVTVSEVLTIADAQLVDGFTWLTFQQGPQRTYVRDTVSLNANVALATHGERVQEALGNGDATQSFQKFMLRQSPLTHVSAETPSGSLSTLEVRVNELLWEEVSSFYNAGPDDRVYITRPTEEGGTIVQFGDGRNGARVPTGQENIRASYRKGMGKEGLVDAGQLSLLLTRPLGVRGVNNPISASGMADRESLEEARTTAPITVLTLDRIVSLRDYEDFARAFAGIAKALATVSWSSIGRRVFVTVAGTDGAEIAEGSDLYNNLLSAMEAAGDPKVPLRVKSFTAAFFTLSGTVWSAREYVESNVKAAIETALREAFSFDKRAFGQPVARSEAVAVIQGVAGVVAVDLDFFYRVEDDAALETILTAALPQAGTDTDLGAELLMIDSRPFELDVVKVS